MFQRFGGQSGQVAKVEKSLPITLHRNGWRGWPLDRLSDAVCGLKVNLDQEKINIPPIPTVIDILVTHGEQRIHL